MVINRTLDGANRMLLPFCTDTDGCIKYDENDFEAPTASTPSKLWDVYVTVSAGDEEWEGEVGPLVFDGPWVPVSPPSP